MTQSTTLFGPLRFWHLKKRTRPFLKQPFIPQLSAVFFFILNSLVATSDEYKQRSCVTKRKALKSLLWRNFSGLICFNAQTNVLQEENIKITAYQGEWQFTRRHLSSGEQLLMFCFSISSSFLFLVLLCFYDFIAISRSSLSRDKNTYMKYISCRLLLVGTSLCSQPISKYSWMITHIHRSVELDKLECLFTRLRAS